MPRHGASVGPPRLLEEGGHMLKSVAVRGLAAGCLVLSLGVGCGAATGGACGGLRPLPTDSSGKPSPQPFGLPSDQLIEGGIQARITKPGFDKLISVIPGIIKGALPTGACLDQGHSSFPIFDYC